MKERLSYPIIAVLPTDFDGTVKVYNGTKIWVDWAANLPTHRLLVSFAALETTSLANVWGHADSGLHAMLVSESARPWQNTSPIATAARGRGDV